MNPGGRPGGKKAAPSNGRLGSATVPANPDRLSNARRILRARANRASVDQRRSTADRRMLSENIAQKALATYVGARRTGIMQTGADVRAKMLGSLRRSKGLPAGQSGFQVLATRLR